MSSSLDLLRLIEEGSLDRETISELSQADPNDLRALLSAYLPDEEVEQILDRIRSLTDARAR